MRTLATLFISLILNPVFCQSFTTYNYSVAEGVPSAETYEVFQDSKGFLWFGTDNGVCRFDGKELEVFNVKDGLSDPVVFGITEDKSGRIWFRTYSGRLSYFYENKIHTYKYNHILTSLCGSRIMLSLHCDSLNQVWFAIGSTIGKIDDLGKLDTIEVKKRAIGIKTIEDKRLLAFYGPTNLINKFQYEDKVLPLSLAPDTQSYHVVCSEVWNDKMYFNIDNSVFEYDKNSFKRVHVGKAPIICMYRDYDNNMWLGYMNNGAERYTGNFSLPPLTLFENNSISKIVQDHEGGFWMSTLENGVNYIPNLLVKNYLSLSYSRIKAVVPSGHQMVIGDHSGKLSAYNAVDGELIWQKQFEKPIISLFRTAKGNLWVSTTSDTYIFDSLANPKKKIKGSQLDHVEKKDGKILAIRGNVMLTFDEHGTLAGRQSGTHLLRSVILSDSLFFFVLRSGLEVRDYNLNLLEAPEHPRNFKISHLLNLNDSIIMACTVGNGFMLIHKNTWQTTLFNSKNNFNADNFYNAVITDSLIWMGTEKGLAATSIKAVVNGGTDVKFLSKRSGLVSNKINFISKSGKILWAFTDEGVSLIPYTKTRLANQRPLFVISDLTINDNSIRNRATETNPRFSYDENNLKIIYRSISFNNPDFLVRYRLLAGDPWIYNESREILFSSLAPGEYNFELQYSNDNMNWTPAVPAFSFTILKPWWNLFYVQVSAFGLLFLLGYSYFKYLRSNYNEKNLYLKIINEHQQKLIQSEVVALERERNRIAKELHDRVGTNLTAIKLIVSQLLKNHKEPLVQDIEDQFQIAIKEIKEIIYGLTPPSLERYGLFVGLKNYIGKLNKSIPIPISLKTFGNDVNKHDLNIIVFRVLQELVTNSIKHSFAKNITIHINSFEDVLNIVYEDDGIGFTYDPVQGGLGLDNIESRINSINGTLKFDSGKFGISYTIDIPLPLNKEMA